MSLLHMKAVLIVVLCVLHEPNYNLKAIIVAIVI